MTVHSVWKLDNTHAVKKVKKKVEFKITEQEKQPIQATDSKLTKWKSPQHYRKMQGVSQPSKNKHARIKSLTRSNTTNEPTEKQKLEEIISPQQEKLEEPISPEKQNPEELTSANKKKLKLTISSEKQQLEIPISSEKTKLKSSISSQKQKQRMSHGPQPRKSKRTFSIVHKSQSQAAPLTTSERKRGKQPSREKTISRTESFKQWKERSKSFYVRSDKFRDSMFVSQMRTCPSSYESQLAEITDSYVEKLNKAERRRQSKLDTLTDGEVEEIKMKTCHSFDSADDEKGKKMDQEPVWESSSSARRSSGELIKRFSDQKRMLKVTNCLGLPDPEEMPPTARPLLRKSLNKLTLKEMLKLVDLAQPRESQLLKFYVLWAADLQDDSDICFFLDTAELSGKHLRWEIANLYSVSPDRLIIRQIRGRKKSDGSLVVMTASCAFADLDGNVLTDREVECVKEHVVRNSEKVPLPGEWRSVLQVQDRERTRRRRAANRRLKQMREWLRKRQMLK